MSTTRTPLTWVQVKTTLPSLPYPPLESRAPLRTARLIVRSYRENDADELYRVLRSDPEVMIFTARGKPDESVDVTRTNVQHRLPPHDQANYDFIICLAETGALIGVGGSHMRAGEMGWPAVGYMLRKDAWGKGYGTEFLEAFLHAWWSLPRQRVELTVDSSTLEAGQETGIEVSEVIIGVTTEENRASQNVMRKAGMDLVKIWECENSHEGGGLIDLLAFAGKQKSRDTLLLP